MPQRRFKFKLCRLARGERSLNSLPIIQLLLPSPSLFLSLFLSLSCSFCSLYLLFISWEVLSPGWIVDFSLSFRPLCPCESSQEKKFHTFFIYSFFSRSENFSLFCIQLSLIRDIFFSDEFQFCLFLFWTWRRGSQIKSEAPYSLRWHSTVAAAWCFVCVL